MRNWGIRVSLAAAVLTCAAASTATATAINVTPAAAACFATPVCLATFGNETGQPDIDAAIAGFLGTATELYKQNAGGSEEGSLAGSYATSFNGDLSGGTISYTGGAFISSNPVFLLVKDGKQEPAWYLFQIDGAVWGGKDNINLSNFWPSNGAISHISLYGTASSVPDGGSAVMLLGAALMGLATARRYLA